MKASALLVDWVNGIRTLTLNRPDRLNALNDEMLDALADQLRNVSSDDVGVVIRGQGRAFCSGHDLKQAAEEGRLDTVRARAVVERMQAVAVAMRDCPVPIITRVHGYAIGGGAEIALSGDIVIAAEDSVFQFTEAAVGRVVTNGFTNLLPKTVGPVRAKALLMLGEPMTAKTAEEWGLVTKLAPAATLDDSVQEALRTLRGQSAWALGAAKGLVNRGLQADFESSIAFEIGAAIEAELGADAEEAAGGFARA